MVYSPGILSVLPIFYIGWSDSVLSHSEMKQIREHIQRAPQLTTEDKITLNSWTDQRNPPDAETFNSWAKVITKNAPNLTTTERLNLVDLGLKMAMSAVSASKDPVYSNPEVRESVKKLEELLGVDNAYSKISFYNALFPGHTVEIEEEHAFDIRALQQHLDGPFAAIKKQTKTVLLDEFFRVPTDLRDKDKLRTLIMAQCKELGNQGFGAHAFPEEYGGNNSIGASTAIFETLAMGNLSLLIKFGVQYGLFGGAVFQLGTAHHHEAYLEALSKLELAGCFAMTETGHGSNVRDLETTATYLPESKELLIHSPSLKSGKEYIGNALHSTLASVFCQLIVNGENHGIHAVLVPLRDEHHNDLPGITVKDNGYKMGLNGVDNGRIWFDNVRVPVKNLLNKYGNIDDTGNYTSPIINPSKRFFTMLGALVGGRVSVAMASNTAAKKALDIAINYALKRRQFKTLSEEKETLLLDYPTHQERLFPLVAKSYALTFALETLRVKFVESAKLDDKREVEALAAALKSYASWHATDTIQEAREACGGKGYLAENELSDLKADTDIFTTFEGDNHVLMQLVAKSVLTEFKQEFNDGGYLSIARYLLKRVTAKWVENNPISARNTNAEHLLDSAFHTQALSYREERLLFKLADRMRSFMKKKLNPSEIFLRTQTHMIALANAHVERFINDVFTAYIDKMHDSAEKNALKQMQQIFALDAINRDKGWFLENDFISGDKSKAIRKVLVKCYRQVRSNAADFVGAFGIPVVLRNAEILNPEIKEWRMAY